MGGRRQVSPDGGEGEAMGGGGGRRHEGIDGRQTGLGEQRVVPPQVRPLAAARQGGRACTTNADANADADATPHHP